MLDLPILTALCAIIVTAAALVVDAIQTRSIRKINQKVEGFQQQDIGEAFGNWLLKTQKAEDGEEITNFVVLARGVGHEIARSFSMAAKGIASGDARLSRSIEQKVLEGLQDPQINKLLEFCDGIGIDRQYAGPVLEIARQKGVLDRIIGKQSNQGNGGASWG